MKSSLSKSAFTCNRGETSFQDETRPRMKKFLFTREFHPRMKRVEFHPGMKFNLKENLIKFIILAWYDKTSDDYFLRKVTLFIIFVRLFSYKGISEAVARSRQSPTSLKKRLWQRCFPVNFANFLRTPLLTEHIRWLLLAFPDMVLRNRAK